MIVLELNGHLSHAVPLMVCVLASYAISEYIKPVSFFEMLAELGGLDAKIAAKGKIIIKDVLELNPEYKELEYLSLSECSEADLVDMVRTHCSAGASDEAKRLRYVPIVDSSHTMNLLYQVKLSDLWQYCEIYYGPLEQAAAEELEHKRDRR